MEPSKHIDEKIKRALEGLESGFDPSTWDRLSNRLDFEDQEAIDDLYKSSLTKVNVSLQPGSWEAMEQLIEADEAVEMIEEEAPLDSMAFEKLNNLTVPYNDDHWSLMAKRLEEEFSLRHILYRYKVAEMALMALLILTIVRFMPLVEEWMAQPLDENIAATQYLTPADNPNSGIALVEERKESNPGFVEDRQEEKQTVSIAESPSPTNSPALNIATESSLPTDELFSESSNNAELVPPFQKRRRLSTAMKRWQLSGFLPVQSFIVRKEPRFAEHATIEAFQIKQNKLLQIDNKRKAAPQATASLPLTPIDAAFAWELPNVETTPSKKRGDLRFSVFTTTDLNYVITPANQISVFGESVKTEYSETMASGYGGGVTVSWKHGRFEFETGGIYSFKRYIPNTPIFIFDTPNFFIKEDFNGIQLDLFQVPLNIHYYFKNTGKWHFYANMGVSANFITSTIYEIDHERQALSLIPPSMGSPDDEKSIKDEIDFTSGLVDGGELRDNFYMSANIGIGIERYLSPKWTLFLQPNYQHFFMSNGIGANMDKIYTTSFHLGTRFDLK